MSELKLDPNKEYTLMLVKPDGYHRGLVGKILARVEQKGYAIVALRVAEATDDELQDHYEEHRGKHFFESMVDFMQSGKIVAAVIEGTRVVEGVRSLVGTTNPTEAAPGLFAEISDVTMTVGRSRTWCTRRIQLPPLPARLKFGSRKPLNSGSR